MKLYRIVKDWKPDTFLVSKLAKALLTAGVETDKRGWHLIDCHEFCASTCCSDCEEAQGALVEAGYLKAEEP